MIINRLIGGLGNQMFQYVAGRALALENKCELKLDISGFNGDSLHNGYEMDLFNINTEIANLDEVTLLCGGQSKIKDFLRRKLKLTKKTHFIERDFLYDPSFFSIKSPSYIEGYWQSYKYVEKFCTQIRSELIFTRAPVEQNREIADRISQNNSVSVHVRRRDYVSNPSFSRVHGFVGHKYYEYAIQRIFDEVERPVFFVFSDDMNWARRNLGLGDDTMFISHNTGALSFEDMRLMTLCKHNIIANSTFSWWGAWLNNNSQKLVIYPHNWFADRTVISNYCKFIKELMPTTWISSSSGRSSGGN